MQTEIERDYFQWLSRYYEMFFQEEGLQEPPQFSFSLPPPKKAKHLLDKLTAEIGPLRKRKAALEALLDNCPGHYPPDWDERRHKARQRAGGKCEACGKDSLKRRTRTEFHCHHITPHSQGGNHSLANLRFLCEKCHGKRPGPGHELIRKRIVDQSILHDPKGLAAKRAFELRLLFEEFYADMCSFYINCGARFFDVASCESGPDAYDLNEYRIDDPDGRRTYRNVYIRFLGGTKAQSGSLKSDGVTLWCGQKKIAQHLSNGKVWVARPSDFGVSAVTPGERHHEARKRAQQERRKSEQAYDHYNTYKGMSEEKLRGQMGSPTSRKALSREGEGTVILVYGKFQFKIEGDPPVVTSCFPV